MFDQLYECPFTVARYHKGPMLEERLAFLTHLANQGYSQSALRSNSRYLLAIARALGPASQPRKSLTHAEVKRRTVNHCRFCYDLYPLAVRWLRFVGRLPERPAPLTSWAKKTKVFADYMEHEEKLRPATVRGRCWFVTRFLDQLHVKGDSLQQITPRQIDTMIQKMLDRGSYTRGTIRTWANALRAFFRFAEARGWCHKGLAAAIRSPRVFSQVMLPLGPSWDDVRRLLAITEGDQRHNIRARPMLMLLAIYGLRGGEVSCLRLEDFDWEHEVFRVVSSKTQRVRTYPLMRAVGDAILRYLREGRPRSPHRQVFLSLHAPFRPVRNKSLSVMVATRLRSLNVSLPHYGAHALRHACATRLLATGLSLKEIGDQLGHTDPNSTRIYAKVDLAGLRQVANFDLGGVL
jgi:integrase/recombinase XerD